MPHRRAALEHLMVFARLPRLGQAKTRLAAVIGAEAALRLYRAFLCDTIALVQRLAPSRAVEICFEETWQPDAAIDAALAGLRCSVQGPGDLGRRLARGFARSRAAGHRRTVVIGSDAPTLPDAIVEEAFRTLAGAADIALAPAADGGYVLLGLRGDAPEIFRDIPWGTPEVAALTVRRAAAAGRSLAQLTPWYDVDDAAGLARLRADLGAPTCAAPATRRLLHVLFPTSPRQTG